MVRDYAPSEMMSPQGFCALDIAPNCADMDDVRAETGKPELNSPADVKDYADACAQCAGCLALRQFHTQAPEEVPQNA